MDIEMSTGRNSNPNPSIRVVPLYVWDLSPRPTSLDPNINPSLGRVRPHAEEWRSTEPTGAPSSGTTQYLLLSHSGRVLDPPIVLL